MKGKTEHAWIRSKGYLHFDYPISDTRDAFQKVERYITSPENVAQHSFYPFIDYKISSRKVTRNKDGKLVPKSKERPIAFASHVDSQIYAYYSKLLGEHYEAEINNRGIGDSVLAFRSLGMSNIDFAKQAFDRIRAFGECGVVAFDISGFFDNLDHETLKRIWCELLSVERLPKDHYNVFKSITKFSLVSKDEVYEQFDISKNNPRDGRKRICTAKEFRDQVRKNGLISGNPKKIKGIPQGSAISALLSNVYMLDFDERITEIVSEINGVYFRYCDDMLFIIPPEFTTDIVQQVNYEISELKLDINPDKTEIREFRATKAGGTVSDKPLQYLGFTFDGQQILIRSAALARYSERMRRGVRLAKATKRKRDKTASKPDVSKPLFRRKLYEKYSHQGRRNFIRYGLRAAETMNSKSIRRQLKPLWERLQKELSSENH
jgi:RNA-directed DNA polymerase